MQAWIKGLTAAIAMVVLGGMAYGCDQADTNGGRRIITYSDGTSVEEPINTSYEGAAPAVEIASPSNRQQAQVPAPGFDRDMDAYQHPPWTGRETYGAIAKTYGPAATLNAPNAQVPNGTADSTQSIFEGEQRPLAPVEPPAIQTGAERVVPENAANAGADVNAAR